MAEAQRCGGPLEVDTRTCSLPAGLEGRFSDVCPLGYGAGGVVYSGRDRQRDGRAVSIKHIALHDQRSLRQALREIKIVRKLKHDNIVSLHEVLDAQGTELKLQEQQQQPSTTATSRLRNVYFIQELMQTSLKQLIGSTQLSPAHVRLLMYQMLRGLKYLHSANVLHRDLKPANLFVNCDTLLLKIGDFGTSRILDPCYNHTGHLTAHVGTCWYRSPESILSPTSYTKASDVWSAGCVMAETLVGRPLLPGTHDLDQLLRILDTVSLTDRDWSAVLRVTPNKLLKNHPFRPRQPIRTRLVECEAQAVDLIEAMLTFDASLRVTSEEVLSHPYFDIYACSQDEPVEKVPFHIEDEVDDLPLPVLQRLFLRESVSDPGIIMETRQHATVTEVTHTLEEIFQLSSSTTATTSITSLSKVSQVSAAGDLLVATATKNRPETPHERRENQRNTENTLRSSPSASSIIADSYVTKKPSLPNGCHDDEEEKEVADCSPSKIREDLELGIHQILNRAQVLAISVEELGMRADDMLHVEVDDTENSKEFSKPSPKELSPNHDPISTTPRQHLQHEVPSPHPPRPVTPVSGMRGATAARKPPHSNNTTTENNIHKDSSYKKQRLKQDQQAAAAFSRKLLLDKIESEKRKERDSESLTSEELDNLYRLPTDHLAMDRDLTNQRLKQRSVQVSRRFHQYRHQRHQDLTNEDKMYHVEGACGGGYEHSPENSPDHSETEEILQTILGGDSRTGQHHPAHHAIAATTGGSYDIDIALDATNIHTGIPRDPLSSPESPPSPNNTRAGARPKKSPKKQRAT